jgi:hypothetical protein
MSEQGNGMQPKILVEMTPAPGVKQVSLNTNEISRKSMEALDNAMVAIKEMSTRVSNTMDKIIANTKEIEVTFGLKLTIEGSAIITKAGVEATINVKLVYKN